jgi:hypothetical protein
MIPSQSRHARGVPIGTSPKYDRLSADEARVTLRGRAALVGAAVCALVATAPAHSQSPPPTLRLISASESVTITRHGPLVPLDLGVLVASSGGDFQLNVVRPDYSSPAVASQVDAKTGAAIRPVPNELLRGWHGLRDFIRVGLRTRDGKLVAARTFHFCPNAGGSGERTSDDGPPASRYPAYCAGGSPFVRGMVWGIDAGWAVPFFGGDEYGEDVYYDDGAPAGAGGSRYVRAPNGRYVATVRITPRYAQLFGIAPADAVATVAVRVKGRAGGGHEHGDAIELGRKQHAHDEPFAPVPTIANPDPATLPDLVALPAWQVRLQRGRRGREFLAFAATPWNAGPAPMVVEGFRKRGEDLMDAFQYFFDEEGEVLGRAPVGALDYDARRGHEHWHFLQFSSYTLLDAAQQAVVRSRKQAFCLVPTDAIDMTVRRTNWRPGQIGFGGSVCGSPRSIWVREQLDVGWGDTYFQSVPGQSFEVTDLPNGRYYIRIDVNPLGLLKEASTANNTELRAVELRGPKGKRRVVVHPWHGIRR